MKVLLASKGKQGKGSKERTREENNEKPAKK